LAQRRGRWDDQKDPNPGVKLWDRQHSSRNLGTTSRIKRGSLRKLFVGARKRKKERWVQKKKKKGIKSPKGGERMKRYFSVEGKKNQSVVSKKGGV